MPFKSEKQKRFFYSRAAGNPPKKRDGDLSQEEAKSFIEHSKEEIARPKFFKTMKMLKKAK